MSNEIERLFSNFVAFSEYVNFNFASLKLLQPFYFSLCPNYKFNSIMMTSKNAGSSSSISKNWLATLLTSYSLLTQTPFAKMKYIFQMQFVEVFLSFLWIFRSIRLVSKQDNYTQVIWIWFGFYCITNAIVQSNPN